MSNIKLEICAYDIGSAIIAQQAGAHRVELCASPAGGGVTPSLGSVKMARQLLSIGLFVMIRPREGDFYYSDIEFQTLLSDIEAAKQAGANGVVSGVLCTDGNVDVERTKILVDAAGPMEFTFHRAFDMTPDPFRALEDIIETGANRVLTSGQKPKAIIGAELIAGLVEKAGKRIAIMAGSGINPDNLLQILVSTKVNEVHLSARKSYPSSMQYQPQGLSMGAPDTSEFDLVRADSDTIKAMMDLLKSLEPEHRKK